METLKSLGAILLWLVIIAGCLFVVALFFVGAEWLSLHLLPWLLHACVFATAILFLILLPLSLIRRARNFTGVTILLISYLFGISVWMEGLLITLTTWGVVPVIIGLCFAGVGVVPIGMLAALFHGMWGPLLDLILLLALTFGCRFFAIWIADRYEPATVTEL